MAKSDDAPDDSPDDRLHSIVGGDRTGSEHLFPKTLIDSQWQKSALTGEEAGLEQALDDDTADAVFGDLEELQQRESHLLSARIAAKRRRARVWAVRWATPRQRWIIVLKASAFLISQQLYCLSAVMLVLISSTTIFSTSSEWVGGGHSQKEMCGMIGLQFSTTHPGRKFTVEPLGEEGRWTGIRHREYRYVCLVKSVGF